MGLFNKVKSNTYFDLSSREKKKIVSGAVLEANEEQRNLVKEYGAKFLLQR